MILVKGCYVIKKVFEVNAPKSTWGKKVDNDIFSPGRGTYFQWNLKFHERLRITAKYVITENLPGITKT